MSDTHLENTIRQTAILITEAAEKHFTTDDEKILFVKAVMVNLMGNLTVKMTPSDQGINAYIHNASVTLSALEEWFSNAISNILKSEGTPNVQ
jgi:hypothetical protein